MKKFLAITAALVLVSSSAYAVISGSAHDFSGKTYVNNSQICEPCHVPHNATNPTVGPLWNHTPTANASFTLYTSPTSTLDATLNQPTPASEMCLGCHDGSVAVDSFGGSAGGADAGTIGSAFFVGNGGDLSGDHPVSFTYNAALASTDGELTSPNSVNQVDAGGILPLFGGTGELECATCHDVHNGAAANAVGVKLLNMDIANSTICLACHIK